MSEPHKETVSINVVLNVLPERSFPSFYEEIAFRNKEDRVGIEIGHRSLYFFRDSRIVSVSLIGIINALDAGVSTAISKAEGRQ